MTKRRNMINIFLKLLCCASMLWLSGCKPAVLDPKGLIALQEKHLLITSVLLMLIVVIPVIMLTFIFAWKYRKTNSRSTYSPDWGHSTLLEIVWWTIPCIIIAVLAAMTWISSHKLDPYRPLALKNVKTPPLVIQAIALDWKWLFIYPKQNIAAINIIHIPVNVPVEFSITADAPMNSFQIPQLAGQIYAMAGMRTKLNVIAGEIGAYRGMSTNYSGNGFSGMHFIVQASAQKDFDEWVKTVRQSPQKLTRSVYNKLAKPSENNSPEYFSSAANNLFEHILIKFMKPMPEKTYNAAMTTPDRNYASSK